MRSDGTLQILLFFPHNRKYFCHEQGNDRDKNKKYDFPFSIEKNGCHSEARSKDIYDIANVCMSESEFEKSKMEVMRLVSFHRIFPLHDTDTNDIDKVDEIDSYYRHCGCDFTTCDDRERRDKKCEKYRTRIAHNPSAFDIMSSYECGNRQEYHDQDQDKLAIFDGSLGRICEIELQSEKS